MKTIDLDFVPRFRLLNILGATQADMPLADLAALYNVWTKIVFSDEDESKIVKTDAGNGSTAFTAPTPDFGRISIQIEDAHAAILDRKLDSPRGATIHDVPWIEAVKRQLKGRGNATERNPNA
jgi:hypothetical protein